MSKSQSFIPKFLLIVLGVIHLGDNLPPLIKTTEEILIFFQTIEVIDNLLKLILFQAVPVVNSLIMNIKHLTSVLRFIEIEVVKSFHCLDDAR